MSRIKAFLSRLRHLWAASMATPLPDAPDESHSLARYQIAEEVAGESRIASKAREAANIFIDSEIERIR